MSEEKISRRSYAKYAAAGIIVVAGGAAASYYATRPSEPSTTTSEATTMQSTGPEVKGWKSTREFAGSELRFGCSPEAFFVGIGENIQAYMDATGINVVLESMAYEAMHDKAMLDITSSKSFYNVWGMDGVWLGDVVQHVTPLNEWIERDDNEVQYDDFSKVGKFIPNQDGTIYGMTLGAYDAYEWYRTDLLEKVGQPYPQTADKAVEILESLGLKPDHKPIYNELTGKEDLYGYSMQAGPLNVSWSFSYFLNAFGGNWIDPQTEKLAINDDIAIDALEWYKKLFDYGPPGMESYDFPAAALFFDSGKAVFTQAILAEHYLSLLDPATPVYGKVANDIIFQNPDPNSPFRKRGIKRGTAGVGWFAAIPKNADNKEAAWNFAKWMIDAGNELRRENADSARISVIDALSKIPKYKMFLSHTAENREYAGMGYPDADPPIPELGAGATQLRTSYGMKFYDIIDPQVHLCMLGKVTAKQALDEAYKQMIAIRPELAK